MNTTSADVEARVELLRFAAAVYDPSDVVEVRFIRTGGAARSGWDTAAALPDAVEALKAQNAAGCNVYAGANPRRGAGQKGDKSVPLARTVFADFDHVDPEEAALRWESAGLPEPTAIVASGHGTHVYVRLAEPVAESELPAWTEIQKDLAAMLDADPRVHNPERVMRLPGFLNVKEEPAVPCRLVRCDPTRRVPFAELRSIVPPRPSVQLNTRSDAASVNARADARRVGGDNRVERCRKYLDRLPPAVSGQGGHDATFTAACRTWEFGLDDGEAWVAMCEFNETKCLPPWTDKELRHKLDDARRKVEAAGKFGCRLKEAAPAAGHNGNGQQDAQPFPDLGDGAVEPRPAPLIRLAKKPDAPAWAEFPLDALPPVMRGFAESVGRSVCVNPALPALPMLSVAGAAVGNAARARMSADLHAPPNVWTAPVVRSGERKTPVLKAVMAPIYARQAEAAEEHAVAVATYENDLRRWKAAAKSGRGDAPAEPGPYPHLYLAEATTEAIAHRLTTQKRGLPVVLDELGALFSGMDQYRSGGRGHDREVYCQFYDAGPAKIDRRSATPPTLFIPRAFVAVTGMIQPGALARALGPAEFDTGLAARFLFASPPPVPAKWVDVGVADEDRRAWRDLLGALLDMPLGDEPALIPPSDAAMRLWAGAHDWLEAERHAEADDRMRAARAKLIGVIPRLALIFQCVSAASGERSAGVRFIDEVSMTRAVVLAEWFTRETRRVYGLLADAAEENDIIARIEANGGAASVRDLMRWSREFRTAALAESYLTSLVHEGVGRWAWAQQQGRGQPRRVFILLKSADADTNPSGAAGNGNTVSVSASKAGQNA